jgi:hypothetical protein
LGGLLEKEVASNLLPVLCEKILYLDFDSPKNNLIRKGLEDISLGPNLRTALLF